MKRSNFLIGLYLVLIFASGIAVGGFASRLYWAPTVRSNQPPVRLSPEEWRRKYVNEMQTRVKLNPEQLTRLNTILDETGAKVHAEHERHMQEMKSIREEQVKKNREMLSPEQLPAYEQLRQEHERARAAQQAANKR